MFIEIFIPWSDLNPILAREISQHLTQEVDANDIDIDYQESEGEKVEGLIVVFHSEIKNHEQ